MKRTFLSVILAGFLVANLFAANYVNPTPMGDSVIPVGEVKSGQAISVPIITWGGDIVTIYANGNALQTAKGSIFDSQGLKVTLAREDVFRRQVERFIKGESAYLRATMGQLALAMDALNRDPRTKPVIIYQMTWSRGGDYLVVKDGIKTATDLKGKTIVLQADGPHADMLVRVLGDAGLTPQDVTILWVKDLTETDDSPAAAFRSNPKIHAAFVITPDAMALTSNNAVGTGSEQSVKGARVLLSTKTAPRIIADVYAVRQDYFETHRTEVEKFVHALMIAQEKAASLESSDKAAYTALMKASAKILLTSEQGIEDAKGLYGDAEFVGYTGNIAFFNDPKARGLAVLGNEVQGAAIALGFLKTKGSFINPNLNFEDLKKGLFKTVVVEMPAFNQAEVQKIIGQKAEQGTLAKNAIFSFEILFKPNQSTFSVDTYRDDFARVIELASVYGGAVITVEGHSDPLGYLKKKAAGGTEVELRGLKQAAKNLSLTRANSVRDTLIEFAKKEKGISLDPSQFAILGHGVMNPKTGLTGGEPKAPMNEKEYFSNMRVVFQIVSVEAEEAAFSPLAGGAK
jgi:ABC-type nitrate/sulfonate/bicarbonate transport system substrate-binding protein/outer membrane protein OmpA-like peptidoglycan-associated protein